MTRNYRKFYALLRQLPGAEKEALVRQFTAGRTDSLRAMHGHEYQLMLAAMEGAARTRHLDTDQYNTWRKRAMAAIGGWLQQLTVDDGQQTADNGEKIKAIACRAAGRKCFNHITLAELRAIYAEFNIKQRVARRTADILSN